MFDSYNIENKMMPWNALSTVAAFTADNLRGYASTVVEDTVDPATGSRLSTLIARFPRCILPEVNTHRVFSRNSASSRARSVKTTISAVMNDPYIPLFTINHKGMGGEYLTGKNLEKARSLWLDARDSAVSSELLMLLGDMYTGKSTTVRDDWESWIDLYYDRVYHGDDAIDGVPNIHKQNANRLIEAFMWHEALITSSYWDNFFHLRIDDAAQPEMHAIAVLMRASLQASTPKHSSIHVPFEHIDDIDNASFDDINDVFMASAGECARISYKDRSKTQLNEHSDLAQRMRDAGHMSPFEHQAISRAFFGKFYTYTGDDKSEEHLSGNLDPSWVQFRHIL